MGCLMGRGRQGQGEQFPTQTYPPLPEAGLQKEKRTGFLQVMRVRRLGASLGAPLLKEGMHAMAFRLSLPGLYAKQAFLH